MSATEGRPLELHKPDHVKPSSQRLKVLLAALGLTICLFFVSRKYLSSSQQNGEVHFQTALALMKADRYTDALDALDAALAAGVAKPKILLLSKGVCHENLGRTDRAIAEYVKACKADPNSLDARLRLCSAYVTAGKPDFALEVLERLPRAPQELYEIEQVAVAYASLGKYDKSISLAKQYIEEAPGEVTGHAILGRSLYAVGRYREALEEFREASRISPETGELHYWVAMAMLQANKQVSPEAVLAHLKQAVTHAPNLGRAYYHIGLLCQKMRRFEEAGEAFRAAESLAVEPLLSLRLSGEMFLKAGHRDEGDYRLGLYHLKTGNVKGAMALFQELTQSHRYAATAYAFLSDAYEMMGENAKAEKVLKDAITLLPHSHNIPNLYRRLALLYNRRGETNLESEALRKVIALDPKHCDADWAQLGETYYSSLRYDKAQECFEKAIQLAPKAASYRLQLGYAGFWDWRSTRKKSSLQRAETALREALRLDPNFAGAHFYLGLIHLERNNLTKAAEEFRRTVDCEPGDGAAYLRLGQVCQKMGKSAQAKEMFALYHRYQDFDLKLKTLQTRVAARPDDVSARFSLALLYDNAHDYLKATGQYEWVIALDPNNRKARERLAEIYKALGRVEELKAYRQWLTEHPKSQG